MFNKKPSFVHVDSPFIVFLPNGKTYSVSWQPLASLKLILEKASYTYIALNFDSQVCHQFSIDLSTLEVQKPDGKAIGDLSQTLSEYGDNSIVLQDLGPPDELFPDSLTTTDAFKASQARMPTLDLFGSDLWRFDDSQFKTENVVAYRFTLSHFNTPSHW